MPDLTRDPFFMLRALELARATIGLASPNPQVGCVLVRDGLVLGEGAHRYDERDHAEIVALKQAAALGHGAVGATAYVTLEPCSHHGRTGPCADALISAGIARCVVATADPNPLVSGRGLQKLQTAGIAIELGVEQDAARRLNEAFAGSITSRRPFVTLKAALSVDGRLAPSPAARQQGTPHWLTGPESRAEVHRMRHASDAILTGIGTVLADDPMLTDRSGLPRRRPLMRVVLDSQLRISLASKLVSSASDDLWLFCSHAVEPTRREALSASGVRVTSVARSEDGKLDLAEVLGHLHEARLLSTLAEGGSALNAVLLQRDLADRVTLFYAPGELGSASVPFARLPSTPFQLEGRLRGLTKRMCGEDVCVSGLLHDPWPPHPRSAPAPVALP